MYLDNVKTENDLDRYNKYLNELFKAGKITEEANYDLYNTAFEKVYGHPVFATENEKILDFIEDNRPTDVQTDWERGCAYICDEIERLINQK